MPAETPDTKRSQPFSEAAIVIFIALLACTLWIVYGCCRNASHLDLPAIWQYRGLAGWLVFPFLVVLPLLLLSLTSGLYFIRKRKIVKANSFLFAGIILVYLVFLYFSPLKTPSPGPQTGTMQHPQTR